MRGCVEGCAASTDEIEEGRCTKIIRMNREGLRFLFIRVKRRQINSLEER